MCAVKAACTKTERIEVFFATTIRKIGRFFMADADAGTLIDASSGKVAISSVNVALITKTGTFTAALFSGSTRIAQRSFAYYVQGNSVYVTDPGAVNSWLDTYAGQYDSYSGTLGGLTFSNETTAQTTASVTASAVYSGTTQASATASFTINSGTSSGCGTVSSTCQQN